MGLFENKKKLCPICGNPTPRLLPWKVEEMPICKECADKIDLPSDVFNQMSLESFRQYLDYYAQNKALRDIFIMTYKMDFKDWNSSIFMDTANRLFRINGNSGSLVMEASNLISFCILEDNIPLFEGEGDTLRCHSSDVPTIIESMAPQINQYRMQKEMFEQLERMEHEWERNQREKNQRERNGEQRELTYYASTPTPSLNVTEPFKFFYVELTLEHPYWSGFRGKLEAPWIDRNNPSISAYMREYQGKVDQLYTLAVNLMQLINPNAQEVHDAENTPAATKTTPAAAGTISVDDTINEIQKYKALLDNGIITEEEFTAKKRQLLGI